MRIREFKLSDYEQVISLWKDTGLIIRPGDDFESIRLKLERDPDLFILAEEDEQIIGVVLGAWDGRRGWINHLAVRRTHQRKGVASDLVRELESRLIRKGAKKINAQIYQSNKASLQFFKSIGYEVHLDLIMIGKTLLGESRG